MATDGGEVLTPRGHAVVRMLNMLQSRQQAKEKANVSKPCWQLHETIELGRNGQGERVGLTCGNGNIATETRIDGHGKVRLGGTINIMTLRPERLRRDLNALADLVDSITEPTHIVRELRRRTRRQPPPPATEQMQPAVAELLTRNHCTLAPRRDGPSLQFSRDGEYGEHLRADLITVGELRTDIYDHGYEVLDRTQHAPDEHTAAVMEWMAAKESELQSLDQA